MKPIVEIYEKYKHDPRVVAGVGFVVGFVLGALLL